MVNVALRLKEVPFSNWLHSLIKTRESQKLLRRNSMPLISAEMVQFFSSNHFWSFQLDKKWKTILFVCVKSEDVYLRIVWVIIEWIRTKIIFLFAVNGFFFRCCCRKMWHISIDGRITSAQMWTTFFVALDLGLRILEWGQIS